MAAAAAGGPAVRAFFDEATNTVTYLAWDPATKRGAVIDPVLDWDNRSGEAGTASADAVLRAAEAEGVALDWALETHVHADDLAPDCGDFDRLFRDGEEFAIGSLTARVMHVPGHTPACVAYHVGDAA